ncbi:hypothetical protein [Streptomyces misionensis]|uniref:hypothetical protein n=1 Tax=Streptomyces misionensis TaxID=67331 RepID=UPI003690D9C9
MNQTDPTAAAEGDGVTPPPALTEVGRLRAQVEVLQQDAERDRGLAKLGARCFRDHHDGQIAEGRATVEGHRFALSVTLGLGTGAPWDAIHERVKELAADPAAASAVVSPPPSRAAVLLDAADELGRMDYDTDSQDYGYDTYRDAWNGGVMDGADKLRRLAAEAHDTGVPQPVLPARGDQFEAWLKTQRDNYRPRSSAWNELDYLLDQYRLHADTGTPLTEHVCEGQTVGDCERLEPAPVVQQQPKAEARPWHRTAGFDQHDDYREDVPAPVPPGCWYNAAAAEEAMRDEPLDEPGPAAQRRAAFEADPDSQTSPKADSKPAVADGEETRTTWTPGPVAVGRAANWARSRTSALLATPCDACEHTLNWHRNDVGCTVPDCVCSQFREPERP